MCSGQSHQNVPFLPLLALAEEQLTFSLPLSHAISVLILKEEGKVKEYGGVRFLQDCARGAACCEDI